MGKLSFLRLFFAGLWLLTVPVGGVGQSVLSSSIASEVNFSRVSGTFTDGFLLELTGAGAHEFIRYTVDGSVPDDTSPIYGSALFLTGSAHVRARVFDHSGAGGRVSSQKYIHLSAEVADRQSNLPIVVMDAYGVSDDDLMPVTTIEGTPRQPGYFMLFHPNASGVSELAGHPSLVSRQGLRFRGSSSLYWPKRHYSVQFWDEEDQSQDLAVLGMAAESNWILYPGYEFDRAGIRNSFIFELSRQMGRWAPRTRFVEVYTNHDGGSLTAGDYMGFYAIVEQIREGDNRLGMDVVGRSHVPPEGAIDPGEQGPWSGGYIFKIDRTDPDEYHWKTSRDIPSSEGVPGGVWITVNRPKLRNFDGGPYLDSGSALAGSRQVQYLTEYVQAFEDALFDDQLVAFATRSYEQFIDREAWIDHFLINAFAKNVDGLRLSGYFHKPENGRIIAGPVWDFDRSMGSYDPRDRLWDSWSGSGGATDYFDAGWWGILMQDFSFRQQFYDRWAELRKTVFSDENMTALITGMGDEIQGPSDGSGSAAERNFARWPQMPARDGDFQNEVADMLSWVLARAAWMDRRSADESLLPAVPLLELEELSDGSIVVDLSPEQSDVVYLTLDGSDPVNPDGTPAVMPFDQAETATPPLHVVARAYSDGKWSTPVALSGGNQPPVVLEAIDDQQSVAGAGPLVFDLNEVFSDPDGDDLSFSVEATVPQLVDLSLAAGLLSIESNAAGETSIIIEAEDGVNPPVSIEFRMLVYPSAHRLGDEAYLFSFWDSAAPALSYPENMLFLQSTINDPGLNEGLAFAYQIPLSDASNPIDVEFPYAASSRTRINGLGDEGISFINTGRGRDLGGILLALDTQGVEAAALSFEAGTVLANSRNYALRLQYRIGIEGDFFDLLDQAGQPVEYRRSSDGDLEYFNSIQLPEALLEQPYIQLLWRYHHVSGSSGPRAMLRLGSLTVEESPEGVEEGTVYADWVAVVYPDSSDQQNPELSGPYADPEGTGLTNLMRYALGIISSQDIESRNVTLEVSGNSLVLIFPYDPGKLDLLYQVVVSHDLANWEEILWDSSEHANNIPEETWINITLSEEISSETDSRFVQLRVQFD